MVPLQTSVNALTETLASFQSQDTWDKVVERIDRTSSCARLNLIQMRVLYRIHYSKTKLAKLYPNIDET